MILAATLLWAVEVIVAKRLLADVPASTVAVARMGIRRRGPGRLDRRHRRVRLPRRAHRHAVGLGGRSPALVLTAYVATWYGALARAQAVDVTAVLVFGAVITAALETGIRGVALPSAAGLVMVTAGAALAVLAAARAARQKA